MTGRAARWVMHPAGAVLLIGLALLVAFFAMGLSISSVFVLGVLAGLGVVVMLRPEYGLYVIVLHAVAGFAQYFEMPRVGPLSLPIAVEGIVVLAFFVHLAFYRKGIYFNITESWLLVVLTTLVLLSMLLADYFGPENIRAFRGMYVIHLVLYFLVINLIDTPRKVTQLLFVLILADVALVVSGLLNYVGWMNPRGIEAEAILGRTGGIIGNPNALALTLIGLLPFVLGLIPYTRSLRWRAGLMLLVGATVFVVLNTLSRGGFVSLVAVLLFMAYQVSRDRRLVSLVLMVGVVVYLMLPAGLFERFDEVQSLQGNSRYELTVIGMNMTLDNPWLGVGYGNFRRYFRRYDTVGRGGATAPHNTYTSVSAQTGLPSLLVYLLILAVSWQRLAQVGRLAVAREERFWMFLSVALRGSLVNILVFGLTSHHAYHEMVFIGLGLAVVVDRVFVRQVGVITTEATLSGPAIHAHVRGVS